MEAQIKTISADASDLNAYLTGELASTKLRLGQLNGVFSQVAQLFVKVHTTLADKQFGLPYSCTLKKDGPDSKTPTELSVSTQAMCYSGLYKLEQADGLDQQVRDDISKLRGMLRAIVFGDLHRRIKENHADGAWKSNTFGKEDFFTAYWLISMMSIPGKDCPKEVESKITDVLIKRLEADLEDPFFAVEGNEAGTHPLPLLLCTLATLKLRERFEADARFSSASKEFFQKAGRWFEFHLHRQMSFHAFHDFRFDAAELIFCLEGAIKTHVLGQSDNIIAQVLDVIKESQDQSIYWRPYRPMMSSPQGSVLLPLSIEVATSLLFVLRDTKNFHNYRGTLEKYYGWLMSQKVVLDDMKRDDRSQLAGWHSENAYQSNKIHLWDTARVVMFLLTYEQTVHEETREQILSIGKFDVTSHKEIKQSLADLVPWDYGYGDASLKSVLEQMSTEKPTIYSALLYGPPGTSKTTLARAVAKERRESLVYITPSDFLAKGEAGIEESAKVIFRALTELRNVVIFFDEIDRLILDRESDAYGKQNDIFQFMTPGMLTKINNLRKAEKSVFLVATNYEERIDPAIKRPGRIDQKLLCLPYCLTARVEQMKVLILRQAVRKKVLRSEQVAGFVWGEVALKQLENAAKETPFYVYESFNSLVQDASSTSSDSRDWDGFLNSTTQKLVELAHYPKYSPDLTLASYDKRLKNADRYSDIPASEFLRLCILRGEAKTDENTREHFKRAWACLVEGLTEEIKQEQRQAIGAWLDQSKLSEWKSLCI